MVKVTTYITFYIIIINVEINDNFSFHYCTCMISFILNISI